MVLNNLLIEYIANISGEENVSIEEIEEFVRDYEDYINSQNALVVKW